MKRSFRFYRYQGVSVDGYEEECMESTVASSASGVDWHAYEQCKDQLIALLLFLFECTESANKRGQGFDWIQHHA